METITAQGVAMPRLGFGTFRMPGAAAQSVVGSALALGYRHIDTAAMYENEAAVGAAIAASGVTRTELFVTTKVCHDQLAPDALHRAFATSLRKLGLDHIDLYLIHWPSMDGHGVDVGSADVPAGTGARAPDRRVQIQPAHPSPCRRRDRRTDRERSSRISSVPGPVGIARLSAGARAAADRLCAARPGTGGERSRAHLDRAETRGCAAQIAIAWLLDQPGVAVIPKAGQPESQKANLAALDIRLDDEDRAAIAALPKDQRFVRPPFAPDWEAVE
jgi:2,5-diketo-D-gluconate reductase B